MSNIPEIDLDLEKLFLPAWAQGKTETGRFDNFTGNEGVKPERKHGDRRGPRPGGGFGGGGGGGERRGGGDRPRPQGGPGGGGGGFGGGPKTGDRKREFGRRDDRGRDSRGGRDREPERREAPQPLPELNVTFVPDDKGVESLARQVKVTGRAYPLFQIAQLILQKPERYAVLLTLKKKADGTVAQPLFVCALDDSAWLSEDEAVAHVLKNHFATFYQAERTATEPPKGVYTFVAQCGMSGVILGPPNYHDYQNQLRKLHAERFARMPFEAFKARVKIVKDEAVVKKWVEDQSFKTEYVCLNVPEPLKLASLEEVDKHFRATHKDAIIKSVETYTVAGVPSRTMRSPALQRLIREAWEDQKHFPLTLATKLSQQFANYGLQFFKVNKTVTHVSVARPQYLDLDTTPVSENVKKIIAHINSTSKSTRRSLVEALAPSPKVIEIKPPVETPAPAPTETAEGTPAPATPAPAPATAKAEPTPEQTAIIGDLHWLIHQGHVLEFADGRLETAKKPAPRPQKVEKKTEPKPKPAKTEEPVSAAESPEQLATETMQSEGGPATETVAPAGEAVTSTEPVSVPSEPAAAEPVAVEAAPVEKPAETQV
jgi:hypothetical protein